MRIRHNLAAAATGVVALTSGVATASTAFADDVPVTVSTDDGQVTEVPAGGAETGGGGVLQMTDTAGVVGLGIAGMLLGAGVIALPGARRRRGFRA